MKKMLFSVLLFLFSFSGVRAHTLDHPIVVGLASNLVFESSTMASLMCLAHWSVKNPHGSDEQSTTRDVIGYVLGSALGRILRPEIKSVWKEFKSAVFSHTKVKQLMQVSK